MKKTWEKPNIAVLGIEDTEVLISYAECLGHANNGNLFPCQKPTGSTRYSEGTGKFETDNNEAYISWRSAHHNACGGGDPRNVIIQLFS